MTSKNVFPKKGHGWLNGRPELPERNIKSDIENADVVCSRRFLNSESEFVKKNEMRLSV
jgi:hypothetical protein